MVRHSSNSQIHFEFRLFLKLFSLKNCFEQGWGCSSVVHIALARQGWVPGFGAQLWRGKQNCIEQSADVLPGNPWITEFQDTFHSLSSAPAYVFFIVPINKINNIVFTNPVLPWLHLGPISLEIQMALLIGIKAYRCLLVACCVCVRVGLFHPLPLCGQHLTVVAHALTLYVPPSFHRH